MLLQGWGRPKEGQTGKGFRPHWRSCASAHPIVEKFLGLARLELVWSCWEAVGRPLEDRQEGGWPVAWVGSGVPAPVRAGGLQSMSATQGLWFPCGKGCRKVSFRLRLRDQRTTMLWVGACTGSTKCPQPRRQLPALPPLCPCSSLYWDSSALCSL